MTTRVGISLRAAALVLLATAVSAPAARAGESSLTIDGGWYDMSNASRTANAIFGASGGPAIGFAGEYGITETFFIRAGARFFQRDGERVFVAEPGGEVFELGHPLTVRIIPAYGLLGYRFLEGGTLRPYVGVGGGVASYNEESTVAGEVISFTATKPMGMAVLGLDYGRGTIRFGAEVSYALVPNTIGTGGVSAVYGEDDIGGLTAVVRISFVP
jgi:outer membrane protein W